MTAAEFEQRREAQKRALRMPPAKPITPHPDVVLALITQRRDKKAEDELLFRTLAAARRNCHVYCYLADLG